MRIQFSQLLPFSLLSVCLACSAPSGDPAGPGTNTNGGTNPDSKTGDEGPMIDVGDGLDTGVPVDDGRDLNVREKVCDANGENCVCLRMALLGTLDTAANDKDTSAFVDWLNGNSGGTATVTSISTKPVLDATFLAGFDILLVANVNGWTFSEEEKAAVAEWSKTTGGGIVSLTGFISKDAEEVATSQLISFSGLSYSSTPAAVSAPNTITYAGNEVPMYCIGDALITTAVPFTPAEGDMANLTFSLNYAGAYRGYGISMPADGSATTIATDPSTGEVIAAAKEVDEAGRVFVWGDEWVIFANQWESVPVGEATVYNDCYQEEVGMPGDADYQPGFIHTVSTLYQVKQFWYNVLNWVAPPNECNFTIEDEDVVIIR